MQKIANWEGKPKQSLLFLLQVIFCKIKHILQNVSLKTLKAKLTDQAESRKLFMAYKLKGRFYIYLVGLVIETQKSLLGTENNTIYFPCCRLKWTSN